MHTPQVEGDPLAGAADRGELVGPVLGPPEPPAGGGRARFLLPGGGGVAHVHRVFAVWTCMQGERDFGKQGECRARERCDPKRIDRSSVIGEERWRLGRNQEGLTRPAARG